MKISLAQIKPIKGDISNNIENHKNWIQRAVSVNSDLIVFPELSLTGYEPELARNLAMKPNDSRLDAFQMISDDHGITIGLGVPTTYTDGIQISMIIFQPNQERKLYSKQELHPDELPYFLAGNHQLILSVLNKNIAPAICYESLQMSHAQHAKNLGADIYLASVAKSQKGVDKASIHFPMIAQKFSMLVMMSNCIGFCDNFDSAGQSGIWDEKGTLIEQLDHKQEGLLVFDLISGRVTKVK